MSHLSQLNHEPLPASGVAIYEITVRNLDLFAVVTAELMPEFKTGGLKGFFFSDGGQVPDGLVEKYRQLWTAAVFLCSRCDMPTDVAQWPAVCEALLLQNRAFFTQSQTQTGDDGSDWYDVFQHLIAAGHRHADILDYPFSVFLGYARAVTKQNRTMDKRMAYAVRAGYFLPDAKFESYIKAV